jgi:hypothetical protein
MHDFVKKIEVLHRKIYNLGYNEGRIILMCQLKENCNVDVSILHDTFKNEILSWQLDNGMSIEKFYEKWKQERELEKI